MGRSTVPQRLLVVARQLLAATPTFGGLQRLDVVALLSGNQRPLMFRMAPLAAAPLLRLPLLPPGLGVRLCAGLPRSLHHHPAAATPTQEDALQQDRPFAWQKACRPAFHPRIVLRKNLPVGLELLPRDVAGVSVWNLCQTRGYRR